jgi:hypothetical protein
MPDESKTPIIKTKDKVDFDKEAKSVLNLLGVDDDTTLSGVTKRFLDSVAKSYLENKEENGAEAQLKEKIAGFYKDGRFSSKDGKESEIKPETIIKTLIEYKGDLAKTIIKAKEEEKIVSKQGLVPDELKQVTSTANPNDIDSTTPHPDIRNEAKKTTPKAKAEEKKIEKIPFRKFETKEELELASTKELLERGYPENGPAYLYALDRENFLKTSPESSELLRKDFELQNRVYEIAGGVISNLEERKKKAKDWNEKEKIKFRIINFRQNPYFYTRNLREILSKSETNQKFQKINAEELGILNEAIDKKIPLKRDYAKIGEKWICRTGDIIKGKNLINKINKEMGVESKTWEVVSVFQSGEEIFLSIKNESGAINQISIEKIQQMMTEKEITPRESRERILKLFNEGGPKPETVLTAIYADGATIKYTITGNDGEKLSYFIDDKEDDVKFRFFDVVKSSLTDRGVIVKIEEPVEEEKIKNPIETLFSKEGGGPTDGSVLLVTEKGKTDRYIVRKNYGEKVEFYVNDENTKMTLSFAEAIKRFGRKGVSVEFEKSKEPIIEKEVLNAEEDIKQIQILEKEIADLEKMKEDILKEMGDLQLALKN